MRVGVDAWGDAQQYPLLNTAALRLLAHSHQLVAIIHHERADAHIHRVAYILVGFVVSVKVDAVCGKACALCSIKLSARNTVNTHTFLGGYSVYFGEAQSLGCVKRKSVLAEMERCRIFIDTALLSERVFVHNVKWSAVLFGKLYGIDTADGQVSRLVCIKMLVEYHCSSS